MPRSAKRILLGMCSPDPDLIEPIPCAQWHDCTKAHGSVCLDPNMTVSVCLYAAGIMTTSWLSCEMIVTFQILILGNSRIKIKGSLIFGLFVALVMIIVPSLLAANDAFGGDLLCLPSRESTLFHILVVTMAANMLIGFIVRLLVECNIETPAFIEPLMIEQLLTHVYRMTSMHLYVATSWSMLFFSMFVHKRNLYHLGIGTVSLQGTFLLITLGVINKELLSQCSRILHRKRE
ncbi:hypothetical protein EG68_12008 [Paragonimus skrjabini miyazakii]|uniref:Uncharacterized protein n=1 Tax=Paragonimus skrjabini miyazakii TaxID=59628 RepID=A0A8S9YDI1_9TREM|nr:hypothetical protein EG68_12008 [Paragonimus skrjabini miyazakii]